jgi:hypothetical protein
MGTLLVSLLLFARSIDPAVLWGWGGGATAKGRCHRMGMRLVEVAVWEHGRRRAFSTFAIVHLVRLRGAAATVAAYAPPVRLSRPLLADGPYFTVRIADCADADGEASGDVPFRPRRASAFFGTRGVRSTRGAALAPPDRRRRGLPGNRARAGPPPHGDGERGGGGRGPRNGGSRDDGGGRRRRTARRHRRGPGGGAHRAARGRPTHGPHGVRLRRGPAPALAVPVVRVAVAGPVRCGRCVFAVRRGVAPRAAGHGRRGVAPALRAVPARAPSGERVATQRRGST